MRKSVLKLFVSIIAIAVVMSFSGIGVFAQKSKSTAVSLKESGVKAELKTEKDIDNRTTLANGTYELADKDFIFEGGTGKAKYFCKKVIVKEGKAYGEFETNSSSMTHVFLGEKKVKQVQIQIT